MTKNETVKDAKPEDTPLENVLVRYYNRHASKLRSAETSKNCLAKWSNFFKCAMVSDLVPEKQAEFVDRLKSNGYSNEYINRILTTGIAALNYAFKNQEITYVPPIHKLPAGKPRDRILTIEESARLLDTADGHLFWYCLLAFNTSARPEAILNLTINQIDFDNRLIDLNPDGRQQTKKYRPIIPITKTLLPWLRRCESRNIIEYRGKPVKSIKTSWRNTRDEAGLSKDVIPYTIRHTIATEMRKRNVPPWEVAGFLGHLVAEFKTTHRYAKYAPDYLSNAAAAIDDYFQDLQKVMSKKVSPLSGQRKAK